MKFRKKPVVIEAYQFNNQFSSFPSEFRAAIKSRTTNTGEGIGLIFYIETLEGDHQIKVGDWIIKGVKGEFYPCKPDIFKATYEPIEDIDEKDH